MFNNLIYFIVVLLVYTTYQPADEPVLPIWAGILFGLLACLTYYSLAQYFFNRLKRLLASEGQERLVSTFYQRLMMRMSILAIVFFIIHIYFFGFKDLIQSIPLIGSSLALTGLAGLILFASYLSILWTVAYGPYARLNRSRISRSRFVLSQLRFNLPIILPWFLLSLGVDFIELMPQVGLKVWLTSGIGQIVFFLLFLGILAVVFPALIRYLWGLTPLPEGPHREAIEEFCSKHDFRFAEIMLWPLYEGEALTAGVMGLVRRWRYILITKSLLNVLDDEEMTAVLAHELGHVKRHHLLFYLLFFTGYLVLAYSLFDLNFYFLLSTDWTLDILLADEGRQSTAVSLLFSLPLVLVMIVYFRFIMGAFMRNFERQADLFSFRLTGAIKGLVGSLEKIAHFSGQSRNLPSWHHFSVAQRVEFLEASQRQPSLADTHDRKVRRMILAFCLALVLVTGAGILVHERGLGEDIDRSVLLRVLKAQARRNPDNARVNQALGDTYLRFSLFDEAVSAYKRSLELAPNNAQTHLSLGDTYLKLSLNEEAITAYERALRLAPNNPIINNNLAWVLVTKEGGTQEEKVWGLSLATKAARLNAAAFILDTLAEAFYVNGRPDLAVQTIDQAMSRLQAGESKEYYLKQRKKFSGEIENQEGSSD
ncbi:MAG: M48 family metalloprotease [Candidatus Adiutricales bacterium]